MLVSKPGPTRYRDLCEFQRPKEEGLELGRNFIRRRDQTGKREWVKRVDI